MAFTIHQQPAVYSPAYNKQIFVVSSTNYTQPNFRYIAKYYIGSDVITEKTLPNFNYNSCYFNAGRKVENLVTFDISKSVFGYQTNGNSIKSYYVEFYEEYDIAGVLTQSALLATSSVIKIWNGEVGFLDYQSYDQDNYLLDENSGFLNHSLRREVRMTDYGWLYYMTSDVAVNTNQLTITAYTAEGGTLLATTVLLNPYQTNATLSHHHIRFDCSPAGLNQISAGQIDSGSQPIIPSTCTYYEIEMDSATTPLLLFDVVGEDCKYETFRLHYQNNNGAFESFNFTKASNHTEEIKKEKYKSVVGGLTSSSAYSYNKSDRSTKTFFTSSKESYKIRTNWLSEEYKEVLEQLVSSPVVYWDNDTHGLIAIDIKNTSFVFDKKVTKKNFTLEIDFELSYDNYRQRY